MRAGPLLAAFVLMAGCVDPEARTEAEPTPELPPAPPDRILVTPTFHLEDAEGRWQRNIMLGQEVFINATRTSTANLTELSYTWVEEDQAVPGGTLWPGPLRQAIRPGVEGTHAILVVSRSITDQEDYAMIHLGVSVEETRSYDLAAAPLSAPEACRPAESVLGGPATAREDFAFFSAALQEVAVFSARAGDGVQLAWCHGQEPLESHGEDGWTRTLLPLNSVPRTVSLWIANTGASQVEVDIERHYPGTPMH